MKKLKNAQWTQVLRVEHRNIAQIHATSEYDDVQNALTNLSVMGNDENGESEIMFDAQAFEKPP